MNKPPLLLLVLFLAACAAGPDYERPATDLPGAWGGAGAGETDLSQWWNNFDDPRLVVLIEKSLAHNNDLKAAAANVEAAAAALGLARADYLPTVNAIVNGRRASGSESGATPVPSGPYTEYSGGLVVNYEFDIWGRIRRANEAALAELRHDAAVRDGVHATIAASVASAYFEMRALDRQIALLERLHETRVENLRLQKVRLDGGLISPYEYEQARSETFAVAARLPVLRNARSQALTALAVLGGESPRSMFDTWTSGGAIDAGKLPAAPVVPMGLPSKLLERRPDIRAAEQQLVAANARIGVAKAAYFPSLSLTGFAGGISTAFSTLFDAPSQSWEAGVALAQPLTDINRTSANVAAAEARHSAATAEYSKTVQLAFKETLDALGNVSTARAVMQAQDERVEALLNAYRVATARFDAGRIGYLELLDVERQLRAVEQQQVSAKRDLLQATVDLYRALGGGWRYESRDADELAIRD